ncbi:hypothetical protein [Burkholderia sp. LMU1-1-1.1]|uniref:hypothetical protein n=1 Tax=Burkholderia sp. LMU1-1-1.1 TaxID=3135266 RepID=UPI00343DAFF3
MSLFCSRQLKAINAGGIHPDFLVAIDVPIRVEGDWVAKLYIGDFSAAIFGVDSWQAVTLAMKFINSELSSRKKHGWKFFAFGSDIEIDFSDSDFNLS